MTNWLLATAIGVGLVNIVLVVKLRASVMLDIQNVVLRLRSLDRGDPK